jgi:glucose-6-phosphate 1-dehydrogenase
MGGQCSTPTNPAEEEQSFSVKKDTEQRLRGLEVIHAEAVHEVSCQAVVEREAYRLGRLSIVVLGASGDLAKKKTYPSLLDLFVNDFLPSHVNIMGFARSKQSSEEFRTAMKPWLLKVKSEDQVDRFLQRCEYFQGTYGNAEDFQRLDKELKALESKENLPITNRLFYFAIPPDAFLASAKSIKASAMADGFNRLIIEKPFGHDLASANQLASDLNAIVSEDFVYRIDHYLGKEALQNLLMFRFGNHFLEPLWNNQHVASVRVTFKEDFGTEGRGGYFTNYGIIRDIIQNHLMQVISVVCMEPPTSASGLKGGNAIRDAKVKVVESIKPFDLNDVVIGQYIGADGKPGYLEDDSIKDAKKAEMVPTYCSMVMYIDNDRWRGVPIMVKAGKALDERKAEIRVQFKDADCISMFGGQNIPRNELVIRLQPEEVIYMKTMMKTPGLSTHPTTAELDLTYKNRFKGAYLPDAYTRLILESLMGSQENFVRSDEIMASWKLFDPLIKELESGANAKKPLPYAYGSRGPKAGDELFTKAGFKFDAEYAWAPARKTVMPSQK